jgi:hypothetical protein
MGEEMPPELPAESNESTQIPVTEGSDPYPDREQDPERAHSMALEGDELRTQARDARSEAKVAEDFVPQYDAADSEDKEERHRLKSEVIRDVDKRFPKEGEGESFWRDSVMGGVLEREEAKEENKGKDDLLGELIHKKQKGHIEGLVRGFRSKAERLDQLAKQREEWAGILHDHPVDEAYKDAHPEVSFTPEGLIQLEELAGFRAKNAERHKGDFQVAQEEIDKEDWASQNLWHYISPPEFDEELDWEDDEEQQEDAELKELLNNDATTIKDLKEHVKRRLQENTEEVQEEADKLTAILDYVRNGRTAERSPESTTA